MVTPFELDVERIFSAPEPWAALASEHERGWIASSPFGLHVLEFEAAFDLLRDRRFHPDAAATLDGAGIFDPTARRLWLSALLGSHPDAHDRLRRLVAPYFTRKAVTELRDFVAELTARRATPLAGAGPVDVATALTSGVPPAVFTRMIGAPEADAEQIGKWSSTILQIFARNPAFASDIEAAIHELLAYVDAFIDARRTAPEGEDMISALLTAEDGGDRLSTDELKAVVLEALEASTDNTASSLATLLYAAALHPEQWHALQDDPSLIPMFVEEVARLWPRIAPTR
jgi:cytochrome P450